MPRNGGVGNADIRAGQSLLEMTWKVPRTTKVFYAKEEWCSRKPYFQRQMYS
jgi:hypothetical protein